MRPSTVDGGVSMAAACAATAIGSVVVGEDGAMSIVTRARGCASSCAAALAAAHPGDARRAPPGDDGQVPVHESPVRRSIREADDEVFGVAWSDWTSGYSAAASVPYTFGYYGELNPLRLRMAFIDEGIVFPNKIACACELGFGQGLSINLHAAASGGTEWWGTDFTPAQASFAQQLAAASGVAGASTRLSDQAFEEFCHRADLPDFDFIGLHGIWSWISDENRRVIVDFLRRKLKVGGVVYISYNAMPGSAVFGPMRDLLAQHAALMSAPGAGALHSVDRALAFADRLLAVQPAYALAHPQIAERIRVLKESHPHYVAHEYFNRHWDPMSFAQMAEWLAPAKLEYACSAHFADHVMKLSPEQQALLAELPEGTFRESVRDFIVDQSFRRDYWIKGLRRFSAVDQRAALRRQSIVVGMPRATAAPATRTDAGSATSTHDEAYGAVLDAIGECKHTTVWELERSPAFRGLDLLQFMRALMVLSGPGHIQAAHDPDVAKRAREQTDALNAFLLERARGNDEIKFLASPVTGGGHLIGRMSQLFLLARMSGKQHPVEQAAFVWHVLSQNEGHVMKDGKPLEGPDESIAELTAQATEFAKSKLPILVALGIA